MSSDSLVVALVILVVIIVLQKLSQVSSLSLLWQHTSIFISPSLPPSLPPSHIVLTENGCSTHTLKLLIQHRPAYHLFLPHLFFLVVLVVLFSLSSLSSFPQVQPLVSVCVCVCSLSSKNQSCCFSSHTSGCHSPPCSSCLSPSVSSASASPRTPPPP